MPQYDWEVMADQQRDLLVAEKVLELTQEEFKFGWPAMCNYTTQISDAWKLVEKLRQQEIHFIIESFPSGYRVSEVLRNNTYMSQNIAEAISLVALRAKGADV